MLVGQQRLNLSRSCANNGCRVRLILDIIGFVLIAFEWRHMYMDQRFRRLDALQRAAGYPGEIDPDEAMPRALR